MFRYGLVTVNPKLPAQSRRFAMLCSQAASSVDDNICNYDTYSSAEHSKISHYIKQLEKEVLTFFSPTFNSTTQMC